MPNKNSNSLSRINFKVGDYTENLLSNTDNPIKIDNLLLRIKEYLPETYIESIRANLSGDPKDRFVFFLDGYVGLKSKQYDKRYQIYSVANKKRQYAESKILEFMSFVEEKHRSPQPHGLEEEESLYRWYLYFMKTNAKETRDIRETFINYLKEYDQWIYSPYEYSYKRNCDQFKWYVEENVEIPTEEDEPELLSWFNFQLDYHQKYKDKRKSLFIDLLNFLSDYGIHFYDSKSVKGREAVKTNAKYSTKSSRSESALEKYSRLFREMLPCENALQDYLLLLTIGKLFIAKGLYEKQIPITNDLLTTFADVCIDNVGTASSYNIAIPFLKLNDQRFWTLLPKENVSYEEIESLNNPTFDFLEQKIECAIMDQELVDLFLDEKDSTCLISYLLELINTSKCATKSEPSIIISDNNVSTICEDHPLKNGFKQYLYSLCEEKTANSYISCLQNSVYGHAKRLFDPTITSFYDIGTKESAEGCFKSLMKDPLFIKENKISHNKFTAVIKHYISFLDQLV